MKKKISAVICSALLLTLWGCGAKPESAPEPAAAQTEVVAMSTQPVPTEPEEVKEIIMAESYYFSTYVDDVLYQRWITFYPNAGFYDARWTRESTWGTYALKEDGKISIDIAGETCVFRRMETQLILESGSFNIFSDTGSAEVEPGTISRNKDVSKLSGGLYELDTAKYDFTFDKVLMDLNLTDMTFKLKCFDGSVVEGTLGFEEDRLVCAHAGGRMMFNLQRSGNQWLLEDTRSDFEKGTVMTAQLMFSPQVDTSMRPYTFRYAEDQQQEITADPDSKPLDSYKHLYKRSYEFRCYVTKDGESKLCSFEIYHHPPEGKWRFEGPSKAENVETEEKSDGTIVFSQGGKQWNFHREGEELHYDGGSPLKASGWDAKTESRFETEVPEGAVFHIYEEDYLYDGLYILPAETLDKAVASIQIDTVNQYLWINCYDGNELEGHYINEGDYLRFPVEVIDPYFGAHIENVELHPNEHSLHVWNKGQKDVWELLIGPGEISDSFYFFPVQGVEYEDMSVE